MYLYDFSQVHLRYQISLFFSLSLRFLATHCFTTGSFSNLTFLVGHYSLALLNSQAILKFGGFKQQPFICHTILQLVVCADLRRASSLVWARFGGCVWGLCPHQLSFSTRPAGAYSLGRHIPRVLSQWVPVDTIFLISACVTLVIIPSVSCKSQDECKQKGWRNT